jgi:hypothetical protein
LTDKQHVAAGPFIVERLSIASVTFMGHDKLRRKTHEDKIAFVKLEPQAGAKPATSLVNISKNIFMG